LHRRRHRRVPRYASGIDVDEDVDINVSSMAQFAIAPDASCFMPVPSPFFILSCFMVSFFIVSFDMLSLDIESFDIVSFDIESLDIAPLAWANAAPPLVSRATAIAAIANFFME
jgi:hypothetical protein